MRTETKLSLLFYSKNLNKPSKYLNHIVDRNKRSLFSKIRLGTFDLEIEKSRKYNIPRAERICQLCDSGEVEDIAHFILKCPKLTKHRQHFINTLSASNNSFGVLSQEQKLKYLYFNEDISGQDLDTASDLLFCLKNARDNIFKS